jgi:hypothetical protein
MIEVPEAELRRRLRRAGRVRPERGEIAWKLDGNDLPNGRLVAQASAPADWVVRP